MKRNREHWLCQSIESATLRGGDPFVSVQDTGRGLGRRLSTEKESSFMHLLFRTEKLPITPCFLQKEKKNEQTRRCAAIATE